MYAHVYVCGDLVPLVHVSQQMAQLAVALVQDIVAGGTDLIEGSYCTAQHLRCMYAYKEAGQVCMNICMHVL